VQSGYTRRFLIMLHTVMTSWQGGLHRRGAELPLCDVASHGAVSLAVVLLTNQRRRVACSVDADRFSCRRRSGNAGVDADDGLWVRSCESAKL